ncbi:MAG: DUF6326 family protein [Thermonemataceae bacterium]
MTHLFDLSNIDRKALFSTLWIFVTLNYLYCDLMGLMDVNMLKQYLTGTVEGMYISEDFLLMAALLMELPMAMIVLSRILTQKLNRWVNIFAGTIKTAVMILTLLIGFTSYYLFFATIEISTTTFIVIYAWHWREVQ